MGALTKEVEISAILQTVEKGLPCSVKTHHAIKLQYLGAIAGSSTQKCLTNTDLTEKLVILRENHKPDSDDTLTITIYCKEEDAKEVWNIKRFKNELENNAVYFL